MFYIKSGFFRYTYFKSPSELSRFCEMSKTLPEKDLICGFLGLSCNLCRLHKRVICYRKDSILALK
jgi:hypothetical protein